MSTEIPEFLIEMSKQLNTQDNRITAEPIFNVQYTKWLTCADDRGDKTVVFISDGGEYTEFEMDDISGFCKYFSEYHSEWLAEVLKNEDGDFQCLEEEIGDLNEINWVSFDWPESVDVEKIDLQKTTEVVKSCLTESDAQWFIQRKQHDYPKLEIYVESMVFCPQMIELRKWIMGLTKEDGDLEVAA